MRQDDEEAYERDEAISALADMRDARDEARRDREEAIARAEKVEAERDRCINIAGEALGTDPSLRTVACVEALALWCEQLREARELYRRAKVEIDAWRESSGRFAMDFEGACEREIKCQEMLDAANADCACLRARLREARALLANPGATAPDQWFAEVKRALGEE